MRLREARMTSVWEEMEVRSEEEEEMAERQRAG